MLILFPDDPSDAHRAPHHATSALDSLAPRIIHNGTSIVYGLHHRRYPIIKYEVLINPNNSNGCGMWCLICSLWSQKFGPIDFFLPPFNQTTNQWFRSSILMFWLSWPHFSQKPRSYHRHKPVSGPIGSIEPDSIKFDLLLQFKLYLLIKRLQFINNDELSRYCKPGLAVMISV